MDDMYVNILAGNCKTDGLGVVVLSLGLSGPLIYLLCIFFFGVPWRALSTSINSEMDLVARISIATALIRETLNILEHVRQSISRRCRAWLHVMAEIWNISWDVFTVYFLFIIVFMQNKAFCSTFCFVALYILRVTFQPMLFSVIMVPQDFSTSPPSLYKAFGDTLYFRCFG